MMTLNIGKSGDSGKSPAFLENAAPLSPWPVQISPAGRRFFRQRGNRKHRVAVGRVNHVLDLFSFDAIFGS
jgi:hypothetical protein